MLVKDEINEGARLLLVGEAPGETEDIKGKPFQGKAGQKLDDSLAAVGLNRFMFNITNVLDKRPPNNNIKKVKKIEKELGAKKLKALIEEIKPLGILTVGNTSLWALKGFEEISDRRGSIYDYNGIPLLPTLHPAAVLRNPKTNILFKFDLARFKDLIEGRVPNDIERVCVINPTEEQLQDLAARLRSAEGMVALDIENDDAKLACLGFSTEPGYSVCVPASKMDFIREAMALPFTKVLHNSPYDIPYLRFRCGFDVAGRIDDTLAMHQALHPELPRDLATLTSLYTLQPYYKDQYKSWKKGGDWNTLYGYNCLDVSVTKEIADKLLRKLDTKGLRGVYEGTVNVLPHAFDMALTGMRVDTVRNSELLVEHQAELDKTLAEISSLAGKEININSPPQVADWLYKDLRIPKRINRDTGNPTTGEKALMAIYPNIPDPSVRKALDLLFKARGEDKFIGTYLKAKVSKDGRLHTSFNPAGTETGRWSASKFLISEGANLQTVSPQWKEIFIADEGTTLWMADYSQIEARFVAWLAGDVEQMALFNTPGGDIHKFNASRIYRKPMEEIVDRERQVAKSTVHGLNYGMTPPILVETVNKKGPETGFWLTLDQAKKVRELYLDQFPAILAWQEDTWKQIKKYRALTNPFGRRRIFLGSTDSGGESIHTKKEGLAFIPQSTVPDMMNLAIISLRSNSPAAGFVVALQIHDALLGWGPTATMSQWLPEIRRQMDIPVTFKHGVCRVPVDIKVGTRWSELKKV